MTTLTKHDSDDDSNEPHAHRIRGQAVTASQIKAGSVSTAHLAGRTVTAHRITVDTVTAATIHGTTRPQGDG